MKKTRYILVSLVLTILIGISSCDDYLDFQPEAEIPAEEFFVNEADAEAALWSCYGVLSHWDIYGGQAYLAATMVPSDDAIAFGFGPLYAFENFTFGPNEGRINAIYRNRYQSINLSNQLITNLPDIPMSEGKRNTLEGEARFLRALHYFELTRFFGDIPIVLSPSSSGEANIRRPLEEVYEVISEDLQFAYDHLPSSWAASEKGRATRWSAAAYMAKLHLYKEEWNEVLNWTNDIINNSGHDLFTAEGLDSFYHLFRVDQENNIESIFEAQSNGIEGNPDNISFGRQYGQVIGPIPWGWGNVVPTDALADAFDAEGDTIRKKVTILYAGDVTLDGDTINTNPNAVPTVNPARYCGKAYVPIKVNPAIPFIRVAEQNVRLMRFAEVLLMNAEAAAQSGGDVATPLNRVRARVGLPAISAPTLQDVYKERRLELANENERFFDLVRTGRANDVLGENGFIVGKHELFPIPENEIELTNGLLTQNPNW